MLGALVLCNDAQVSHDEHGELVLLGDPTETALLQVALGAGIDIEELRTRIVRVGENAFDSARKRMSTVHDPIAGASRLFEGLPQDRPISFVKGAIDGLIDHAAGVWSVDGPIEWTMHGAVASSMPTIGWPATVDGSSALRTASTTRRTRTGGSAAHRPRRDGTRRARTRRHDRPAAH
jgi:hypothetical protein